MSEGLRRRRLLQAVAASSLLGATTTSAEASPSQPAASGWPMFAHDPANTGHAPTQTGPTTDVTPRWRFRTDGAVLTSPAVVDDTVYVGSEHADDAHVYAVDTDDGTEQWRFKTDLGVESSPAVVDGTVYVGSDDGHVYALASGQDASATATSSPTADTSATESARLRTDGTETARPGGVDLGAWLSGWEPLVAWLGGVTVLGPLVLGVLLRLKDRVDAWRDDDEGPDQP